MQHTSQIKKAVIPVAGLGTRMLPATKAIPKEMLPVVDKPLIQYVVNEAVAAGIKEIVLVTHASKNAIHNHFDTSFELESQLENRLKRQELENVRSIVPNGVSIIAIRQAQAKGLGHAINCAYPVVGDNPFAVLLPDVLIDDYHCDLKTDNLAAMIKRFNESGQSQIMVEAVPHDKVDKYGVIDCNGHDLEEGRSVEIKAMIEKPSIESAPSNLAIVGRYILSAKIWPLLNKTDPGVGGEIQLTDAIGGLLDLQAVEAYRIVGQSHDCGSKFGYMQAQIKYALRDREIGERMRDSIDSIVESVRGSA